MFDRLRDRGIKTRILNPQDAFWDYRLGVNTIGYHPASGKQGEKDWRLHYTPTPYGDIRRLFQMINLSKNDVLVDLGCGLGRAVFTASWMGAKRAVGVEVVQHLCDGAEENRRNSCLADRDIEFVCTNALDYPHRDTTVLYMFHPFGEDTLRQALLNMENMKAHISVRGSPKLRIVYMNPVFDHVIEESGRFERIGVVPPPTRWLSAANSYRTSLWQSRR
jgi:predicted RNA methylase